MKFIDLEGLTTVTDARRVAGALGLEGEYIDGTDRMGLLAKLVNGAGVTVYTGPLGAAFWTGVSGEVTVRVEPDGYEVLERNKIDSDNGLSWSLRTAGLSATGVSTLMRGRSRVPTGKVAPVWHEAARLRADLLVRCEGVTPLREDPFPVTVITDPDEQLAYLAGLDEFVALDWEWDEDDPSIVDGLSIATRTHTTYLSIRSSEHSLHPSHGVSLRELFGQKLRDGLPCVFHQGRADLSYQYDGDPADLSGKPIYDTLIMAALADPYSDDLGLKSLVRKRLGREPRSYPGVMSKLPLLEGARYAGADARNTYDLFHNLLPELIAKEQWSVYMNYEQPLMPIVASMEKFGQPVDVEELQKEYNSTRNLAALVKEAVQIGYGYDISNPECTREWFKSFTGYRPFKLDQRTITKYQQGEVDVYLCYKQAHTRANNFLGKALNKWVSEGCPEDFRLYPKFNQAGKDGDGGLIGRAARTGRFTSSGSKVPTERAFGAPNFQNQPRTIRDVFVAPNGMKFSSWDFSAIELRLAAGMSNDPVMMGAINSGEDLHDLFRKKILELTGVDVGRPTAKQGNFEQLYHGGAQMLVRIMRKMRAYISLEVAEAIVRSHREVFRVYHEWAEQVIIQARERGYSETLFGRRRYLPDLYSADPDVRGNAERAAVNHVIQGTAADILKLAMVRLQPVYKRVGGHIAITVHDEIDGWVGPSVPDCSPKVDDCGHAFCSEVKEAMTDILIPGVKLAVEGGVGKSWGSVH